MKITEMLLFIFFLLRYNELFCLWETQMTHRSKFLLLLLPLCAFLLLTGKKRRRKLIASAVIGFGIIFTAMSMIESGREIKGYWEYFGHDLAGMHKADASDFVPGGKYGFWRDNFIGAGKQKNTPCDTWIDFFREQRLKPQVDLAVRYLMPRLLKGLRNCMINLTIC